MLPVPFPSSGSPLATGDGQGDVLHFLGLVLQRIVGSQSPHQGRRRRCWVAGKTT